MSEFIPDIIINKDSPLFNEAIPHFKGKVHKRCFEARVKLESFDKQTFGEIVVGDTSTLMRPPHLGEFDLDHVWVHFECGQVYIELTDKGKEILAKLKAANVL